MRYFLTALALLGLALPVHAANTGEWRDTQTAQVRNALNPGQCIYIDFADDTDPESKILYVGHLFMTMSFDGDTSVVDGLGTGRATLYHCLSPDIDRGGVIDLTSCREAKVLDSDLDGFADTGTFDDTNDATKGLSVIHFGGYIYVDPVADPGTGNMRFQACGLSTTGR